MPNLDGIERVVVVMLGNRFFDYLMVNLRGQGGACELACFPGPNWHSWNLAPGAADHDYASLQYNRR